MGILDFFSKKPSQEKFAAIFIAHAKKQGFSKSMTYEAAEFRLLVDNGTNQIFNLGNAYRDYCKVPKIERETVLIKYTSGLNSPTLPTNFEEAKKNIMPTIKGMGQMEYVRLLNRLNNQESNTSNFDASMTFSDDAVVMLAYDTEHTMTSIGHTELQNWGISLEDAIEIALSNLRDRTVDNFGDLDNGVLVGQWNDSYDTSRVLLSDVIYRSNVKNDPIIMIPSRGCILLTSSSNIAGQLRMVDYAFESIEKDGRFVSSAMYQLCDGKISQYQPNNEDVKVKLEELKYHNTAEDYVSQKELLEKIHEATGVDIFVATYSLVRGKENNKLSSFCTWTKDVDTLLPRTDFVAFVVTDAAEEQKVKIVTWNDAISIGDEFLSEVEGYPVRYRVKGFPNAEKLNLVSEVAF
ncbi:hypothetical protein [Sulfurirhabdus autotrophica]|uniref:DUF1444 family protein n=1 Tax=Sulfurirhabdus autotrophica TaxID=1706046 RepID=A0A4R3XU07_9PROT|nr:hypothetical protein [Sulfurirhabdus autotrophica]TCV82706.1 hypothetical protein EDC63_11923 [Sulfurirhabdus autotrophica]